MPKLSDRKDTQRFIGLFVGKHHSGKTCAEASFPKPLHVNDFDGRIGGAQVPWLDQNGITYDYFPPKMPNLIGEINKKLEMLLGQAQLMMNGQSGIGQMPQTYVTDSLTNQTFAFMCQAIPLTHTKKSNDTGKDYKAGRWIGITGIPGPEDYQLEAQATYEYMAFLKSLPIPNILISAHIIDLYGKQKDEDGEELTYSPNIVIGERLSIRDKISENVQSSFDHVFRFERRTIGREDRFFVTFRGGLACSSYDWLPYGEQDWTKKNFYEFMMGFKPKEKENV